MMIYLSIIHNKHINAMKSWWIHMVRSISANDIYQLALYTLLELNILHFFLCLSFLLIFWVITLYNLWAENGNNIRIQNLKITVKFLLIVIHNLFLKRMGHMLGHRCDLNMDDLYLLHRSHPLFCLEKLRLDHLAKRNKIHLDVGWF